MLEQRGFPTDTRKLTKAHLHRIVHVNQNMMFYIALTSLPALGAGRPSKLVTLDESTTRQEDDNGILRLEDLNRVIWNNLERMQTVLYHAIEHAASSEPYNWSTGWTNAKITAMDHDERKRVFYLAARRAGEDNYAPLAAHRGLAAEALAFWREYWQRAVQGQGLQETDIHQSLEVLRSQAFAKLATDAPWCLSITSVPEDKVQHALDLALGNHAPLTIAQIAKALQTGRRAYDLIPNIMPVALLSVYLPIIDPANSTTYLAEGKRAMAAFRLNRAWYWWVEHHQPVGEDALGFYAAIGAEFGKRSTDHNS